MGKTTLEDHFDRSPELESRPLASGKTDLYNQVVDIANLCNIQYLRQKGDQGPGPRGFTVPGALWETNHLPSLYGDDVIIPKEKPATRELCDAFEEFGLGTVGIKTGAPGIDPQILLFGCHPIAGGISPGSGYDREAQAGGGHQLRYLGAPGAARRHLSVLENTKPGAGGEIQLTDAMRVLAQREGMIGVEYLRKRYDMGNKLVSLQAIVEVGLKHPEIGEEFHQYLLELSKSL